MNGDTGAIYDVRPTAKWKKTDWKKWFNYILHSFYTTILSFENM